MELWEDPKQVEWAIKTKLWEKWNKKQLATAIQSYTLTCSSSYDQDFTEQIQKIAPIQLKRAKIKCKFCKKEFEIRRCELKWRYYCSKECKQADKEHTKCAVCGLLFENNFTRKRVCCSRVCSDKMRVKPRKKVKCRGCEKVFEKLACRKNTHFCSKKCVGFYKQKRVKVFCQYCNKSFITHIYRIKTQKRGKFCSKVCYWLAKRKK